MLVHLPKTDMKPTAPSRQHHAVFHSFLSENSKHDADINNAHSKGLISLLKEKKVLTTSLSPIWENTDGCAKQYRCASAI